MRHGRLVDVSPIGVDLQQSYEHGPERRAGKRSTLISVTFQSLILGFGGSFVHDTYTPFTAKAQSKVI